MPICGWLSSTKGAGWPSTFYLFGAIGLLWTIVWLLFASSSPEDHRWISEKEKNYILNSLGKQRQHVGDGTKHLATPWKEIWTSLPFWAVILAHCGQNWGFWTLLTEMPTYLNSVLHFDLNENGLLSALPYLVMWIFSIIIGWISDKALAKGWLSVAVTRKLGNSIAHWGPALALIGLGFVPENKPLLAVGVLTVAVGLNGASYIGFQVNHLDLSPNFAGTLMGITNCLSNIMGIIAPITAGRIAYDETNADLWRTVFFVSAAVYFVFNLFFIIFGSVEIQPWNNPHNNLQEVSVETIDPTEERNQKDIFSKS
ncbi:hypothetical protein J437_LFUL000903 [Ladona fulva]|uniref:Inorganic phosphate cotransporter n=1 Tax=Ladona fulva TaxID=123851 RepID=A0A8K0K6R7_LADFU|nr:hypothetical protein J437_LFUL000903 [Ladona fulva]